MSKKVKYQKDEVVLIGFHIPRYCHSEEYKEILVKNNEWTDEVFVWGNLEFGKTGLSHSDLYEKEKYPHWKPVYAKIVE